MPLSTNDFIKQVRSEVDFLYNSYSHQETGKNRAFAQWALEMLFPSIDPDEAFNSLLPDNTWNIHAQFQDDESGTFYLLSAQYPDDPEQAIGSGVIYGPLDSYKTIKINASSIAKSESTLTKAANANLDGYTLSIIVVLFGNLDETIDLPQLEEKYKIPQEHFLCLDLLELRRRYSGLDIDVDSKKIPLTFEDYARFNGPVEALVGIVQGQELKNSLNDMLSKIYDVNLRAPLGATKVNKQMKQTLGSDQRDYFWYFNNGITMLCKSFHLTNGSENTFVVDSPRIVNGAQTTDTLVSAMFSDEDSVAVTLRLIAARPGSTQISDDVAQHPGLLEDLYLDIARYTNSQNAIEVPDFRSTELVQKNLHEKFKKIGWFYEHRRGIKPEEDRKYEGKIKMVDLAQRWFSFDGHPSIAIRQKRTLFEEAGHYGNIFMLSRSAEEYLVSYLLFDQIKNRLSSKIKAAKDEAKIATENAARIPFTARNYLAIGRATWLAVAHMTALIAKALRERFEKFDESLARRILPYVKNNELVNILYSELEDTLFRLATQLQGEKHKTMHSLLSDKETLEDLYDLYKYVLEKEMDKGRDPFEIIPTEVQV